MSKTLNTFFVVAFIGLFNSTFSQNEVDPILLEVGERKISISEFEAVYKKNNTEVSNQAIEDYLNLYVNFRLKVQDAEDLGKDTMEGFKKELAGYRRQLAEPYLSDNEVTEELIKEAYDRLKFEIKASHIMVNLDQNPSSVDTLKAFKKIESLRKRIIKGEDFASVAVSESEDPSAKDNEGGLGYFTAMFMVYPFENMAYNTKVGEVSKPVRTQFGYHLINVVDKRESRGEITTAHIMVKTAMDADAAQIEISKMKADEIYEKLKSGASWDEMAAQFSDDKSTATKGGILPAFSSGRMVPEYEEVAFSLQKDGDFSAPVQTKFGFHIVKRISLKSLGSYEEMQADLRVRIARDSRSKKSKVAFINRVKKEYGFKETISRKNEFHKAIDTNYFMPEWKAESIKQLNKEMFTLGESKATQQDFAKYLEKNKPRNRVGSIQTFVDKMYKQFKEEFITNYEDARLESKYPEFKMLMQEYHDGILLFDLTDEKVWSKAVKDSAGMAKFYEEHKNEYMWGQRLEAVIYSVKDEATSKLVRKLVKSRAKKEYTDEDILKIINEDSQLNLEIERDKYSKGDNEIIDGIKWSKGISEDVNANNRIYFVEVLNVLEAQPKELNEVRGLMTSAYQKYLEDQWLAELKNKYPVIIHKEHLSKIK